MRARISSPVVENKVEGRKFRIPYGRVFLKITGSLTSEAISSSDTARVEALIDCKPSKAILVFRPVEG